MTFTFKFRFVLLMTAATGLVALAACSDKKYPDIPTHDANLGDRTLTDTSLPDVTPIGERIIDPEGPEIEILVPTPNQIVSGAQMVVEARITDPDYVDPSSVRAYVAGDAFFPLARKADTVDVYDGKVDVSSLPDGPHIVVVEAADLSAESRKNSADRTFIRDTGPTVIFYSPTANERYAHSVNLNFEVRDPDGVIESTVAARIGSVQLPISKLDNGPDVNGNPAWIIYTYNVVFADEIFSPPLQGPQLIKVTAENGNHTEGTGTVLFVVDHEGPEIDVISPTPGQIMGGIMEIEVSVSDQAGVNQNSVVAVLAGNQASYIEYLTPMGATYTAIFDTRQFPGTFVFPSISVRAADLLGNESEVGFQFALDNRAPIASLDPPENFRMARLGSDGTWECSTPFDPMGDDTPDSGDTVAQVFWVRARVEDQGNGAQGLVQPLVSLVDYSTVTVYVLDDTSRPLVVDTDADGYCDEINPELIPTTTPQGQDEVLALNLQSISPSGEPDWRPQMPPVPLPIGCDVAGTGTDVPTMLCAVTPLTVAIFYTVNINEPAIYSLQPVIDNDAVFCTGLQFDSLANNIGEGWACAAVRAEDNLGNIGVSAIQALCIDYELDGTPTECWPPRTQIPDPATLCLGTQNPITLEVTNTPCVFHGEKQLFRDREVRQIPP